VGSIRIAALVCIFFLFYLPGAPAEVDQERIADQLERFGPSQPDSPERKDVLMEVHALFMNDTHEPLKGALNDLISTMLWEISGTSAGGPKIWYFWNMGYILKAGNTIVGFDLPRLELDPLDDEQKRMLGESLDILFVSHVDKPHIDYDIVTHMVEGAYVVCPDEIAAESMNPVPGRKATVIGMKAGERRTVGPADVRAYEGDDRRGTSMRCFLVSVGGMRVLHTGDQHYVSGWMEDLPGGRVGVLMMGPMEDYSTTLDAIATVDPAYTVPGGLYDMSHPKDTWSGYDYSYGLRGDSGSRVIPMFFGEGFQVRIESSGGTLVPVIIVISAASGIGGVLIFRMKGRERGPGAKQAAEGQTRCEKRYVKNLCLKCRYYTIKSGGPYCTRYNFQLKAEE